MLFIFSTPVLIRHLGQLKTVVFLLWCLISAGLLLHLEQKIKTKGFFTLAQFRGRFCTKLARLVMKFFFVTKHASLMQNRVRNPQM